MGDKLVGRTPKVGRQMGTYIDTEKHVESREGVEWGSKIARSIDQYIDLTISRSID